jgi:hypothetical protein
MKNIRVRLVGPSGEWFNTPEINTPEGKMAKKGLEDMLISSYNANPCVIKTFKPDAKDSFGRWLGCFYQQASDTDVATAMVSCFYGKFGK